MRLAIALTASMILIGAAGRAPAQSAQAAEAACGSDVYRFCRQALPNRSRTETCMIRHIRVVSRSCRLFIERYRHRRHPDLRARD